MALLKKISLGLLLLALLAVVAVVFVLRDGYVIELSEAEIQQELQKKFPIKECVLVFCVEFEDPFVLLSKTANRLHFGASAKLDYLLKQKSYQGKAEFSGTIEYRPEEAIFYLSESRIEKFDVEGVSDKHAKQVNVIATALISNYLNTNPIYRLEGTEIHQLASRLFLRKVDVANQTLRIHLSLAK